MLRTANPTSAGQRHKIIIKNNLAHLNLKNLSIIKKKKGGRNDTGRITTRHIGGGHKQRINLIDHFGETGAYSMSTVINFIYDSNRNNYLMLCETKNKKKFLRLAIANTKIGDIIYGKNCPNKSIINGAIYNLQNVPVGLKISNIQIQNKNSGLITSAGTYGLIIKQDKQQTTIKLPSKKLINLSTSLLCTIGSNSNENFINSNLGKAGSKRWLGIRPTVRGEAMNPIDHPHGGKTSGGVRLKTFYGKLAKFIKKT